MPTNAIIQEAKEHFKKSLDHLHREFTQIQAGRANPAMVEHVIVDMYGTPTPLKNCASVSVPEPQQLAIQPWDRSLTSSVEVAIRKSDLGLNPLNDGTGVIRLNIPPLTEDRRRDLVKVVNVKAEEARVGVRQSRQDALHKIRQLKDISEDLIKQTETQLQDEVNNANKEIDELTKQKEADVMKV